MARSVDVFQPHLKAMLRKAAAHKGTAFVEILQNCNIFNDGAWETLTEKDVRDDHTIALEHGQPLIFGKNKDKGIRMNGLELEVVTLGNGITEKDLIVHDERHPNPAYAFLLSRMDETPASRRRSACCARSTRPATRTGMNEQIEPGHRQEGQGRPRQAAARGRHLGSEVGRGSRRGAARPRILGLLGLGLAAGC